MLIIGVTGNIACGKSTVDAMLRNLAGALIIDADRVTHDLLRDDSEVRDAVVTAFGTSILDADGRINRSRLGRLVFEAPGQLQRLEEIIHPAVRQTIRAELAALPADGTVVVDAVKLLSGDLENLVQSVWWVTATLEQQLERLITARGLNEADARLRLAAQPSLDEYRNRVHVIIDNSGSLAETRNQVHEALSVLRASQNLSNFSRASSKE